MILLALDRENPHVIELLLNPDWNGIKAIFEFSLSPRASKLPEERVGIPMIKMIKPGRAHWEGYEDIQI
jgi:hypothetical protein